MNCFYRGFGAGMFVIALAGQSTANTQAQVYDVQDFDEVSVAEGVTATIRSGEDFFVEAEVTGRAQLDRLIVRKRGDRLMIEREGRRPFAGYGRGDRYSVTVQLPALARVDSSSGADVAVSGSYRAQFDANASSGARLEIAELFATDVRLNSSAGSELIATGRCETLDVNASSGSSLDASGLTCDAVDANASSGSDILVAAQISLDANASSGSDIDVTGGPGQTRVQHSSGGRVRLVP